VVFEVPLYDDGQVPDEIVPTTITGAKAIELATYGFRNLSRPVDQHPGSVWRVPGVVCVDKDLSNTVKKINAVKTELQTFIQTKHPSARARNTFYRREFPGRVMLQVYRKIYVNQYPIEKIRFTWSPYTESNVNLTRHEALEMLIKRQESGFDKANRNRSKALKMACEYVRENPHDTQYSIKKPRSPYPIATIYESTAKPKSLQLSLPLIIGPDSVDDISELSTFNRFNRRSTPRSLD